jgi:hypothetical protein
LTHPYTTFRLHLARHAIAQLAARLRGSAEIVLMVMGPAVIGLLAFAAMPAMLAAAQPVPLALPLLCLHALAMSLPMVLLRPQVAPAHVRAWLQPLPIPSSLQLQAAAAVACMLTAPLALAYAASLAIWLYQRPDWLAPLRAVAGTLLSFILTWACATWLLVRAAAPPSATQQAPAAAAAIGIEPHSEARSGGLYRWRQLFWLPLWRNGSLAGPRQAALLAGTLLAAVFWMRAPAGVPRAFGAILASALLVLLVHEADTALRSQLARLRVLAAAWPLDLDALARRARALLVLGATAVLAAVAAIGWPAHAWQHTAGHLWLALAGASAPLLVLTPPFSARGRMALVAFAIMLLCATGSKLWN